MKSFRFFFEKADDKAGHHLLWVDKAGEVHLDRIEDDTVGDHAHDEPTMKLRYNIFACGNGYAGKKAAKDLEYMRQLYKSLNKEWPAAHTEEAECCEEDPVVFVDH